MVQTAIDQRIEDTEVFSIPVYPFGVNYKEHKKTVPYIVTLNLISHIASCTCLFWNRQGEWTKEPCKHIEVAVVSIKIAIEYGIQFNSKIKTKKESKNNGKRKIN